MEGRGAPEGKVEEPGVEGKGDSESHGKMNREEEAEGTGRKE